PHLFEGSTHAIRSNQWTRGSFLDPLHCGESHLADACACVRFLLNTSKLLLGPAFECRMDRLSAHLKIASNGFGIPSIRVKPNDGSATFCAILDVCIAWKAAFGGRWFGARSQDELDGGRGGFPIEFEKTDGGQFVGMTGRVLRVPVQHFLEHVRRERPVSMRGNR